MLSILQAVVPPPINPSGVSSNLLIDALKHLARYRFINDWISLCMAYGSGVFADCTIEMRYFNILSTDEQNAYMYYINNLIEIQLVDAEGPFSSSYFKAKADVVINGIEAGLVPFVVDQNGNYICIEYGAGESTYRILALSVTRYKYEYYTEPIAEFLTNVFTKKQRCLVWDWPEFADEGVEFISR